MGTSHVQILEVRHHLLYARCKRTANAMLCVNIQWYERYRSNRGETTRQKAQDYMDAEDGLFNSSLERTEVSLMHLQ